MNYVKGDFVIVRKDFVSLAEKIAPRVPSVKGWILTEGPRPSWSPVTIMKT